MEKDFSWNVWWQTFRLLYIQVQLFLSLCLSLSLQLDFYLGGTNFSFRKLRSYCIAQYLKVWHLPHNTSSLSSNDPREKAFLKTMWGKKWNAGNQHFLPFPQFFLAYKKKSQSSLQRHFVVSIDFQFGLEQSCIVWVLNGMSCGRYF